MLFHMILTATQKFPTGTLGILFHTTHIKVRKNMTEIKKIIIKVDLLVARLARLFRAGVSSSFLNPPPPPIAADLG